MCVAAPYLNQAQRALGATPLRWGAQDVSEHASGAYTGQVCAAMLREFGASIVLVGHSERRQYQGETSEQVATKAAIAFEAGLTPVICVGETLIERDSGAAESTVAAQLAPCAPIIQRAGAAVVIAYEPVWAIGTGRTASAEQAQAMHAFIRSELALLSPSARDASILYGGSVKAGNARELFSQNDIDGGLIGGHRWSLPTLLPSAARFNLSPCV